MTQSSVTTRPATQTRVNVRLLRRVQRAILKWPDSFHIDAWGVGFRFTPKKKAPDCETVACIAGWAVALGRPQGVDRLSEAGIRAAAKQMLGLTETEAWELFTDFLSEYGPADTPAQAVARINRFLAAVKKPTPCQVVEKPRP